MNIHEELFIKNFIVPQKCERYLSLFDSKKGRKKLIEGFYHLNDFNEEHATEVLPNMQFAEDIYKILKSKGASENCYVISANSELDQKEFSLFEILKEVVGFEGGTFLSCVAGKLGYHEGEDMGARYIFEKK